MELMSYYAAGWSLILMGIMETVVFVWIYGNYGSKTFYVPSDGMFLIVNNLNKF